MKIYIILLLIVGSIFVSSSTKAQNAGKGSNYIEFPVSVKIVNEYAVESDRYRIMLEKVVKDKTSRSIKRKGTVAGRRTIADLENILVGEIGAVRENGKIKYTIVKKERLSKSKELATIRIHLTKRYIPPVDKYKISLKSFKSKDNKKVKINYVLLQLGDTYYWDKNSDSMVSTYSGDKKLELNKFIKDEILKDSSMKYALKHGLERVVVVGLASNEPHVHGPKGNENLAFSRGVKLQRVFKDEYKKMNNANGLKYSHFNLGVYQGDENSEFKKRQRPVHIIGVLSTEGISITNFDSNFRKYIKEAMLEITDHPVLGNMSKDWSKCEVK